MGSIQTASACEPSDSGYAVISSNSLLSFPKGHKCVLALNAIRRPNDFNVQQERGRVQLLRDSKATDWETGVLSNECLGSAKKRHAIFVQAFSQI